MKILLAILLGLHGAIHYLGFAKSRNPDSIPALKEPIGTTMGYFWAMAAVVLVSSGVLLLLQNKMWWQIALVGIVLSQILIFTAWSDSSKGTILNILLLIPVILAALGHFQLQKAERAFDEIRNPIPLEAEISSEYPNAFLKYISFSQVMVESYQSNIFEVHQTGKMRPNPSGNWMNFTARQLFRTATHEFVWYTEVDLPLKTHMYGLDRYVDGKGMMDISALGAFAVVEERGVHIDKGALIRYIAELNWIPTQLFHPEIDISAENQNSFTVRIPKVDADAAVTFHLDDEGRLLRLTAIRPIDAENEYPWRIELDTNSYTEMNGAFIAQKASLFWDMPEGENHWLDIEVTSIESSSSSK